MMFNKKTLSKHLFALALTPLLLIGLSGCGDAPEVKQYSDRVYVSDHLFVSDGETSDTLPNGYTCIGTVETLLSKSEPVQTNFTSNCVDVGSELYLPEMANLEDQTSSVKLYAKIDSDETYQIFTMMIAIG